MVMLDVYILSKCYMCKIKCEKLFASDLSCLLLNCTLGWPTFI